MDKKKILLLVRVLVLLVFAGVTVYLYLNTDRSEPVYSPETGGIMRRYMTEGLSIEGTTDYVECVGVKYYDNNSPVTRDAAKRAQTGSGVLSAAVYEMTYEPKEESVSADSAQLMCSVSLKDDMAASEGDLKLYRIVDREVSPYQMFVKDNAPAWISDGAGTYLLVRLYPEELLVAEEETPEPTPEPTPEATPTPTPKPKPKATPTPVPDDTQDQPAGTRYATADLNVRSEPDRASKALGVLKTGTALEGVEPTENPEWLKIVYKGEVGYVSAQYVGTRE